MTMRKKNARIWKDMLKGYHEELLENGERGLVQSPKDPSLLSQLRERSGLEPADQMKAYLEACQKAPNASEGTKRKWRKALLRVSDPWLFG